MAKLDIENTFRLYPVRLEDHEIIGIHWQGQYYIDLHLPFGMRSSPYLFNHSADAFEWPLKTNYHIQNLRHYLNHVSPANSLVCANNVHTITQVASQVGILLAPNKVEGPTTHLVFLGILIDTTCIETSLPDDKLHELLSELHSWSSCKKCRKGELLSLIGQLKFACRIIPAGRIFLCRLIDLSTKAHLPLHHITSLGSSFFSLLGTALPSCLTPTERDPQIWNSSQRPRKVSVMASFTQVTGLPAPGLLYSRTDGFSGIKTLPDCSGMSSLGSSVDWKEAPLSLG